MQFEGRVEGNFIIVGDSLLTGSAYFLDCGEEAIAFYIDTVYKTDIHLFQKNTKNDFVGFYYNLTEGDAKKAADGFLYDLGSQGYDMSIVDSVLETNYEIKSGSRVFALCVFLKKSKIDSFVKRNNFFKHIDKILDPEKNTFIRFDRMSDKSRYLLNDLRKMEVGGAIFDLYLIGTAHVLVSEYLDQMLNETIIIEKVDEYDLASVIDSQNFLIENIDIPFPSISLMAARANMSDSKFKRIFRKCTGLSPNSFFIINKLRKAKALLEENNYSVSEVSDMLNFSHLSYFGSKFKEHFGLPPTVFIKKL